LKRVLIIINKLLFRVGLEGLLSREDDLRIQSVNFNPGRSLSEQIRGYEPDVIVVDESLKFSPTASFIDLLMGLPNIRVLVVNTRENKVQIYDKHEIQIAGSLDLISAIKNGRL